jgi:hypothetical protein
MQLSIRTPRPKVFLRVEVAVVMGAVVVAVLVVMVLAVGVVVMEAGEVGAGEVAVGEVGAGAVGVAGVAGMAGAEAAGGILMVGMISGLGIGDIPECGEQVLGAGKREINDHVYDFWSRTRRRYRSYGG